LLFPLGGLNYAVPQGTTISAGTAHRLMGTLMLRF